MLSAANIDLNGIVFSSGQDVSADLLTSLQQNISNELQGRSLDMIKIPGFSFGLQAASSQGKSITITRGVAYDQRGIRLSHPQAVAYAIDFPNISVNVGWLCVKANPISTAYQVNPITGEKKATESLVGLNFYVDVNTPYVSGNGYTYSSDNQGLIICQLSVITGGYVIANTNRSPFLKMVDGTV